MRAKKLADALLLNDAVAFIHDEAHSYAAESVNIAIHDTHIEKIMADFTNSGIPDELILVPLNIIKDVTLSLNLTIDDPMEGEGVAVAVKKNF